MGKKIVMAVVAALGLCSSALADTPDLGMKNNDPASINSSKSSNTETNLGTPAPVVAPPSTASDASPAGTSYSGTSRATATGPTRHVNVTSRHMRRHHHTAVQNTQRVRTNSDVLGTDGR